MPDNNPIPQTGRARRVLAASCLAVVIPGSQVFGYPGVLAGWWERELGAGRARVGAAIFVLLVGVSLAMFPAGRLLRKYGARPLALAGASCAALGALSAFFIHNLAMLYVWAGLMGLTNAFCYLPTVAAVQAWFPEKKGLASGLVSTCFGGGAVLSPFYAWLLARFGYLELNLVVLAGCLLCTLPAAALVRLPGEGRGAARPAPAGGLAPRQALATGSFWFLWLLTMLMGGAGVSMITLAAGFGQSLGYSLQSAVWILFGFNLTNGAGRLAAGFLSDHFGRRPVMSLAFAGAGAAYLALPQAGGLWQAAALAALVGLAFGALFAVLAPLLADCFGMLHFGELFGLVFTAYGFVAGLLGPVLAGWLLDGNGGDYRPVFAIMAAFCLAAAGLVWGVAARRY